MKAAQLIKYDRHHPRIEVNTLPRPVMADNDVRIRLTFAGVNPLDNLIAHGDLRLVVPYQLPQTLGNEFVGIVEEVGTKVREFKVGDRVFARSPLDNIGAFAEEVVVNKDALAKVPPYLTDAEAAAIPLTALTAMQALDTLDAQAGQSLFIAGGTGSFGAMAIPLAVAMGLKVITSGNGKHRQRMLKMGVSQFIDYQQEDYLKTVSDVDLVIDTVGESELPREFAILKAGGRLISLRAMPNRAFAKKMGMGFFKQLLFSAAAHKIEKQAAKKDQQYDFLFVHADGQQLTTAAKILAANEVHPPVGNCYPLTDVPLAMKDVSEHRSKGKVLIEF